MPERKPYISGNWKMFKTAAEAGDFVVALSAAIGPEADRAVDVGLCASFTSLATLVAATQGTGIRVSAQNMHQADEGAFTGEVSARMLAEVGVNGVVLGHSERRQLFGETDAALKEKVPVALEHGFEPILCVGETEEEREAGDTERRLRAQVQEDLASVREDRLADVVIAYEPIWAIGTGKVATPDEAQEAVSFVRALVADRSPTAADEVRILYGGSVKPENAAEILGQADVDGALVGGASLHPDDLAAIVAAAAG
ncbi:MAG: triosephosphate isomerase [Thermoleophilaceae bacterium]|jgi:triosephosphate isomerase|nr:triosephosphate isomerase [Thermoleophilaceae bacterium]